MSSSISGSSRDWRLSKPYGGGMGADVLIQKYKFNKYLNRSVAPLRHLSDEIGFWLCRSCKQATYDPNLSHKQTCKLVGSGNSDKELVIYVTGPNERGSISEKESPYPLDVSSRRKKPLLPPIDISSEIPPQVQFKIHDITDPTISKQNSDEDSDSEADQLFEKPKLRIGIPIEEEKTAIKILSSSLTKSASSVRTVYAGTVPYSRGLIHAHLKARGEK